MTPDVNVLIAASRQDHPHHLPALSWLDDALDKSAKGGSFEILPTVAVGFLRLVTHPKVFVEPTPPVKAWQFLNAILDSPGVRLVSLGEEWATFEQICTAHQLKSNAIPDAWIAAAVQHHHLHLATLDKGFRKLLKRSMVTVLKA